MAQKRMISKQIIDSDAFLDMPLSAQALYFHLLAHADDDGFVGNGRALARAVSASGDDLKLLIAKGFLLSFDSGVVAVTHWRIHNYIAKDRYTPTAFTTELSMLMLLPTKAYALKESYPQSYPQDIPQGFPQAEYQNGSGISPQRYQQSFPQGFPQKSAPLLHPAYNPTTSCIQDDIQPAYETATDCIQSVGADIDKDIDKDIDIDIDLDIDVDVNTNVEQKKDDDETDDDKNKTDDKVKAPPEPVDPETFQGWFKKEAVSGSDADTSDKPIRKPTAAEDMADKVGKLFHQLLPSLPYAGVPDKLVVEIARAGKPLDYYRQVFERAAKSSFLSAPEAGRTWCCSLSWLCRPDVCEQVLAGKYDDYSKGKKPSPQPEQGVTMVNETENGFETSSFFEAALRRSWQSAKKDPEILERTLKENNEDET